jgi:hypothetical protein
VILFVASSALVFALDTAKDSFDVILQIGAGTGLLYLVRWFWWRVTAWCEIVAMVSSFGISILFLILKKMDAAPGTYQVLLITIACTTVLWVATAYLGPQTDDAALINFYHKVRPAGPGWAHVRALAGVTPAEEAVASKMLNFPMSLLGWFTGCITIWSGLFTVGNFLYGRMELFWAMLAVCVVSGGILIRVVNRLWQ